MSVLSCQGFYVYQDGWNNWCDHREIWDGIAGEGWKLHIGGTRDTALRILRAAAPVLQELRIHHKVLPNTEVFAQLTGTQAGKWFVAYPNNIAMAFLAVHEIDSEIRRVNLNWNHENATTPIPGDNKVGGTVIYSRYGSYRYDGVIWANKVVADDRTRPKPGHVDDPWLRYNEWAYGASDGEAPMGFFNRFRTYTEDQTRTLERYRRPRQG